MPIPTSVGTTWPPAGVCASWGSHAAHIIGVVVSDTTMLVRMAAVITNANSWNKRPSTPPMNKMGMNTATKEMLMATTVKLMSRAPCKQA
jgi:hypothetical protein